MTASKTRQSLGTLDGDDIAGDLDDGNTAGNGATAKFQIAKLAYGDANTFTRVTPANGLPIQSVDIGAKSDTTATSDTGNFSVVALIKRLLTKTPSPGPALAAASSPVVIASDQSLVPVTDSSNLDTYITGAANQTALNANLLLATSGSGWLDVGAYRSIAFQIVSASGTVTGGVLAFEVSDDAITPSGIYLAAESTATGVVNGVTLSTSVLLFSGPIRHRYMRIRISTAVTGTTTGVQLTGVLRTTPWSSVIQTVGTLTLPAGSNTIGFVTLNGSNSAIGAVAPRLTASNNGYTRSRFVSVAGTNATVLKASAGTTVRYRMRNVAAYDIFLKFTNSTTVTPGTTTVAFTARIPANGTVSEDYIEGGEWFGTGICVFFTKVDSDTDTTAILAGDIVDAFFTVV